MKSSSSLVFVAGSLSWALAQWFLVWLFARFAGGATAVGQYSLAMAITTPVFLFCYFGLRTIYLTFRARHPWSVYIRLRMTGIFLAVVLVLAYFVIFKTDSPWIWGALIFQKSVDAYLDLVYGRIQRNNRLAEIGYLGLGKTVGTMASAAAVILATGSVSLAIFAAGVVSAVVAWVATRIALGLDEENIIEPSEASYREILRAAFPITVTEGLASVSNYLPLLFLGLIADNATAGIFMTASYLFSMAHITGGILRNVLITSLRLTFENHGFGPFLIKSHRIAALLGAIGLLAIPIVVFAGSPVLDFLYGEDFTLSYVELTLLASAAMSIAPAYIYNAVLNIVNRYDGQAWSLLASLVLGVLCGLGLLLYGTLPPIVVALGVALAVNWGRLIGVLSLTLTIQKDK